MHPTSPINPNGFPVRRRAIPLMPVKPILRVSLVDLHHDSIPLFLG